MKRYRIRVTEYKTGTKNVWTPRLDEEVEAGGVIAALLNMALKLIPTIGDGENRR